VIQHLSIFKRFLKISRVAKGGLMSLIQQTQSYVILGLNRYVGKDGPRCYALAYDEYSEKTKDQQGGFGLSVTLPYEESAKVLEKNPSLTNPLVVQVEGQTRSFGRNQQFVIDRVVSVSPFKAASASAAASPKA
jgi:hypothetical protein